MITKQFVTAGRATFSIENSSNDHFTFKVTRSRVTTLKPYPVYFVAVREGQDYRYIGLLDQVRNELKLTPKSPYGMDQLPVRVFNFAMRLITSMQPVPTGYDIHHEGTCAACGRPLTDPESIRTGFGPVCRERL